MEVDYLPVSWIEYDEAALKLASTILSHKLKLQRIVAISRGGLTLGHILSDHLRLPVATIAIQSYVDVQKQGELKLTQKLQAHIEGEHVVLVDDVSDTGKTFTRAVSYLKQFNPKNITTVSMYYKPHSEFRPDMYYKQTTKWILFPYEPTEMILLITKRMEKEGYSKGDIQRKLESLHFNSKQIMYTRKYFL